MFKDQIAAGVGDGAFDITNSIALKGLHSWGVIMMRMIVWCGYLKMKKTVENLLSEKDYMTW
jgi:hypothetical protein